MGVYSLFFWGFQKSREKTEKEGHGKKIRREEKKENPLYILSQVSMINFKEIIIYYPFPRTLIEI